MKAGKAVKTSKKSKAKVSKKSALPKLPKKSKPSEKKKKPVVKPVKKKKEISGKTEESETVEESEVYVRPKMVEDFEKPNRLKTLDDFELQGKRVLLRLDLNSSIIDGKVEKSMRFIEHAKTVKELIQKGASVVILFYQGRRGESNYMESLEEHAKILSTLVGKNIIYVHDLFGDTAINAIKNLKPSEILVLKNTRSWDGEAKSATPAEYSKCEFVQKLVPYFNLFVQDALSVCHRNEASIVGFPYILQCCVGRVLEKELENLEKMGNKIERPFTLVLGGVKIADYFDIVDKYAKEGTLDCILTGGFMCLLAAYTKGLKLGASEKILSDKGLLALADRLRLHMGKVVLPVDVAIEVNGKREDVPLENVPPEALILDIGKKSLAEYTKIIKQSKTIFVKGSMGNYEKKGFETGTKVLLTEIGKSKCFSLIGGGDTTTAIQEYKIKNLNNISLSGGALLEYLAGKKLPGIEVLK